MGTSPDLRTMTAVELVDRYRRRELSPVEVTHAVLGAVEELDPRLNAFVLVAPEEALEAARQSEDRWRRGEPCGPVDGVPATVKDIITVRGWPTHKGSLTLRGQPADAADAPSTRNLRRNGAILIGKTTTPEFGWKAVTDSPATGITRNPWNPALTPGGSSGGAAVAAATGMGALHIGTDGGGSIRIPASFTGIFGLKPTFGRVPAYPPSVFGTLAHIGPMTRTAADAELMLRVLCEPDSRDWLAVRSELVEPAPAGEEPRWQSRRVGYFHDLPGIEVAPEVDAAIRSALQRIEDMGAAVETIPLADLEARGEFRIHWYASARQLSRSFPAEAFEQLDPGLRTIIEEARAFSLDDYLDAVVRRGELGRRLQQLHDHYDVLVSAAVPVKPLPAGAEVSDATTQERWIDWAQYSYPFNLSQQPAASVPCGFTPDGCPVGLQLVGPRFSDHRLLRLCAQLEDVLGTALPP